MLCTQSVPAAELSGKRSVADRPAEVSVSFEVLTHAGTSEFVTLDHSSRRAELRRPPSAGQTTRATADHQIVEPGGLRSRGFRSHGPADERLSGERGGKVSCAAVRPAKCSRPGPVDTQCHNQEAAGVGTTGTRARARARRMGGPSNGRHCCVIMNRNNGANPTNWLHNSHSIAARGLTA